MLFTPPSAEVWFGPLLIRFFPGSLGTLYCFPPFVLAKNCIMSGFILACRNDMLFLFLWATIYPPWSIMSSTD